MKKWMRFIIFLMAFQMEIRVRASLNLLEQPTACLRSKEICSFQVKTHPFHLKQKSLVMHATEGSVFVRQTDNLWRFVSGALWVEKSPGIEVETVYGTMKASQGQYWIIEQSKNILVRNINANLQVTLRDGTKLTVPDGFEFWIAGVDTKGLSDFGMIQPVDMKNHLPLWYSLYTGNKTEFVTEVRNIKENWGDLVGKSSALYKEVVLRNLASVRDREENQRQRRQRLEQQRQQMKKLYYQRVFER